MAKYNMVTAYAKAAAIPLVAVVILFVVLACLGGLPCG